MYWITSPDAFLAVENDAFNDAGEADAPERGRRQSHKRDYDGSEFRIHRFCKLLFTHAQHHSLTSCVYCPK